jgi:tetratricopeptide (TPR) repeat protein
MGNFSGLFLHSRSRAEAGWRLVRRNRKPQKTQAAKDIVERFPYRSQTRTPLEDAVKDNPNDTVARFNLTCLLYFRGHPQQAVEQWQQMVQRDPTDFGSRRALGLAYEAQGNVKDAIPQMQAALKVKPDNLDTLDDLGAMYAREGRFDEEIALLRSAFQRDPTNDHLAEGLMNADLMEGRQLYCRQAFHFHRNLCAFGIAEQISTRVISTGV